MKTLCIWTRQDLATSFTAAVLSLACTGAAVAQSTTIQHLQGQVPRATHNITTLGEDLAGDRVNLYNGALQFSNTDVNLRGFKDLPVALVRSALAGRDGDRQRGSMGDWDVNVPNIGGVFAEPQGWAGARCSQFSAPAGVPGMSGAYWYAEEFWHGTNLNLPGITAQEVLRRNSQNTEVPADGLSYPLVTRDGWQIRCLPNLQNAAGEGFVAKSPQGVEYRFDWLAKKQRPHLSYGDGQSLIRAEYRIQATQVRDRYGNTVTYSYSSAKPWLLTNIQASDGRSLVLSYTTSASGDNDLRERVSSVSDGVRRWTYSYDGVGNLQRVILPDGTFWQYALSGLVYPAPNQLGEAGHCEFAGLWPGNSMTGWITHPSGAVVTFTAAYREHGRHDVPRLCVDKSPPVVYPSEEISSSRGYARWPRSTVSLTLLSKRIEGPGVSPMTWSYSHEWSEGSWGPCSGASCSRTKTVLVTDPRGVSTRYLYGARYAVNEGQLLQMDEGWSQSVNAGIRQITYQYGGAVGPYPDPVGMSVSDVADPLASRHRPLQLKRTVQQGVTFTWQANSFDFFGRPVQVRRYSPFGDKTELTQYYDNKARWVLGQVASVTDLGTNVVQESHTYDSSTANKTASYAFGALQRTYAWHGDGQLSTLRDAANKGANFSSYMRGIPQLVSYSDGSVESASVDSLGQLRSITNPSGSTTRFDYDLAGRLARIEYPAEAWGTYHQTQLLFEKAGAAALGLPAGHWRQTVSSGNARTVRYFDALWRERLTHVFDQTNPSGTGSAIESRYDFAGRKVFSSYPQRSPSPVGGTAPGISWAHDALGRQINEFRDSELGLLASSTEYLLNFEKRVRNARGHATVFSFQAFDEPKEDAPTTIWAPEGVTTYLPRDVFGKPVNIRRVGGGLSLTRAYVYDQHHRLCKTIEPESGATVQAYDASHNVVWRASGLALPSNSCDYQNVGVDRRINYEYDLLNRLVTTSFGDNSPSVARRYTPDGLLAETWSGPTAWSYVYNNRRLLVGQALVVNGTGFGIGIGIDAHGNQSNLTYPDNSVVHYQPDALGRPTQVSGYAGSVWYHPNGSIGGYALANGVVHSTQQNIRGLPDVWRDAGVLQDTYLWDANGNTKNVIDQQEGINSRSMDYDGLDRLTQANGPWGGGVFSYDALDNLRGSQIGGRSLTHHYDSANRLSSLVGTQNIYYGYDLNGNITSRGMQSFQFDIANRMRAASGLASYAYDGHGRRALITRSDGSQRIQVYAGEGGTGQLLYGFQVQPSVATKYIYLGNRLIAEAAGGVVSYSHVDALGSPVARSNQSGQVVSRTRYEPYGATSSGANPSGIGFTGHVNDADSALIYMQQRYYDPIAGRFLSVDPVVTDANTGKEFGRYTYVDNNPYGMVDPDGRLGVAGFFIGAGLDFGVQLAGSLASGQSFGSAVSNVSVGQVIASGALGAVGQIGGSAAARSIVGGMSNGAKGTLGEVVARVGIAARGETVISAQTAAGKVAELGNLTGRAAKAVPDYVVRAANGSVKVVEAKFGTSGLTPAQQALKGQMGSAFSVSRTTTSEVANIAGYAGAVSGGSAGAAVGEKVKEN